MQQRSFVVSFSYTLDLKQSVKTDTDQRHFIPAGGQIQLFAALGNCGQRQKIYSQL
uniref:Uncharacterized protein n=1 Tax=Rhizobium rhizogenes TaxID=359 RepID=A0A7S5DS68_RHIRH|nr:hypothetical protein pC6.5b_376 [Rhizobium rhizogenes]